MNSVVDTHLKSDEDGREQSDGHQTNGHGYGGSRRDGQ